MKYQREVFARIRDSAAMGFFNAKKLLPGFSYLDVWKQEHLRGFTVAKAMRTDLLADLQNAVGAAIENGTSFEDFADDLTPVLQKKGWWGKGKMVDPKTGELVEVTLGTPRRLRVIFETNKRTAYAQGQWQRIEAAVKTHPYLLYEIGASERHREEHLAVAGTCLPVGDIFWSTWFAPNGYGCKCTISQVSRKIYESGRGIVRRVAPKIKNVNWINNRTGEAETLPAGITPGFNYNPGAGADKWDEFGENVGGGVEMNAEKKAGRGVKIYGELVAGENSAAKMGGWVPGKRKKKPGRIVDGVVATGWGDVVVDVRIGGIGRREVGLILGNCREVWACRLLDGKVRMHYIAWIAGVLRGVRVLRDGRIVRLRDVEGGRRGVLVWRD